MADGKQSLSGISTDALKAVAAQRGLALVDLSQLKVIAVSYISKPPADEDPALAKAITDGMLMKIGLITRPMVTFSVTPRGGVRGTPSWEPLTECHEAELVVMRVADYREAIRSIITEPLEADHG